jgi:hypothetical protein
LACRLQLGPLELCSMVGGPAQEALQMTGMKTSSRSFLPPT